MPEAERLAARVAEGLCIACGGSPATEGRRKCETCLATAREHSAARRERARAQGLCEACMRRKAAVGRGRRCNACADKYLAKQLERDRARRRKS